MTEAFPVQLVTFADSLRSQSITLSSVQQVAHLLIVEYSAMASAFTDVVTALKLLFLTLPVTIASAERSFSKLRLIKNYLRSTMGQDGLRHLVL